MFPAVARFCVCSVLICATSLLAAPGVQANTLSVAAGGDLQAAINNSRTGDTILLQAAATFTGNFVLPVKTGTGTITIKSAGSIPAAGVRVGPADAVTFPKIRSGNSGSALVTDPAAHNWALVGLEFQANNSGLGDIIALGDGSPAQNTTASVPQHFLIDRCFIHGDPTVGQKRGVALNAGDVTIRNSYIADIKGFGQDTQAIGGWNSPGPLRIENNYLEGAGENIMLGGADAQIPGLVTSDVVIAGNYVTKPLAWQAQGWWVKNIFELKNAQRVTVTGNIFENCWTSAQSGIAIMITPRNQDGGAPWSKVAEVEFTYNIIRHATGGFNITGHDDGHPTGAVTTHVHIANNLLYDLDGTPLYTLGLGPLDSVVIDHNTAVQTANLTTEDGTGGLTNYQFTNNLGVEGAYGWIASGGGIGLPSLQAMAPSGYVWTRNVIAEGVNLPAGTLTPTMTDFLANFTNPAAGDFSLVPSSAYRNAGSDGKDLGADIAGLNAAIGGGSPRPPAAPLGLRVR